MYGRFSKNNAVYYLNHIWDRVDEQMMLDKLAELNPTAYGKIGDGYARMGSLGLAESSRMEDGVRTSRTFSKDTKISDYDYIKAVQRKLALGSTVALASQIARVGANALGLMIAGTWIGDMMGEDEETFKQSSPIREFEGMTGLGGTYAGALETMMALGAIAVVREGDVLENKNVNKATFESYWREMITSPGKFLFTTGIGSGFAGAGGLVAGTSFNLGAYMIRDKMGRTGELMDGAYKNAYFQLLNQTLGGTPFFSPYYNIGMGMYGVYNKGVNKGKDSNPAILEETFGDEE
jgi:hypothetical protein